VTPRGGGGRDRQTHPLNRRNPETRGFTTRGPMKEDRGECRRKRWDPTPNRELKEKKEMKSVSKRKTGREEGRRRAIKNPKGKKREKGKKS